MPSSQSFPNAFAIYVTYGGLYKWIVQFEPSRYESVRHIEVINQKVVVGLDPFGIVVLDKSTGQIIDSQYGEIAQKVTNVSSQYRYRIQQGGFVVDSSENLFIAMQTDKIEWQVIKMNLKSNPLSSSTTNIQFKRLYGQPSSANTVTLDQADKFIYVGGHYTNNITNQLYSSVIKLETRTMEISCMAGIAETPSIHAFTVSFISQVHVPGSGYYTDVIFAVYEPLVRDDNYLSPQSLKISQLASRSDEVAISLQNVVAVPKLNPASLSKTYHCVGLFGIDRYTAAIMFSDPLMGDVYYGTVDFSGQSTSAKFQYSRVEVFAQFQNLVNHAQYSPTNRHWYYVGSASTFQSVPTAYTTSPDNFFGYLMTTNYFASCFSSVPDTSRSLQLQPSIVSQYLASIIPLQVSQNDLMLDFFNSSLLHVKETAEYLFINQSCPYNQSTLTITHNLTPVIHTVNNPLQKIFSFGISPQSCSDVNFTEWSVTPSLPFMTYSVSPPTTQISFTFNSTSSQDFGSYTVQIKNRLLNGKQSISYFSLSVISPCTSITLGPFSQQTYFIEDEPLMIDLVYTSNGGTQSACPADIEITEYNQTSGQINLVSNVSQHIQTINKLKIYSPYSANVGKYYFQVKATIQGTAISDTEMITLTIFHECHRKPLTPIAIPNIKLNSNLISGQIDTYTIMHLDWKPLISRCIQPVEFNCSTNSTLVATCSVNSTNHLLVQVNDTTNTQFVNATIDAQYSGHSGSSVQASFIIEIADSYADPTRLQDIFLPPLVPTYYVFINSTEQYINFDPWIAPISSNFSGIIQSYSADYYPNPYSSSITVKMTQNNFTFKSTSLADDKYNLTIRIRGNMQLATLNSYVQFHAIFINPCHPPHSRLQLETGQSDILSMTNYTINQTPDITVTQGTYKLSNFYGGICSSVVYYNLTDRNLKPINSNLFTYVNSTRILRVQTSNNSLTGTYNFTMQISSQSYPSHIIYREFQIKVLPSPLPLNSITIPTSPININSTLNTTSAIDLSSFQAVVPSDPTGNYDSSLQFSCQQSPSSSSSPSLSCPSLIYTFNHTNRKLYVTGTDAKIAAGTKHSFRVFAKLVSPVNGSDLCADTVGILVEVTFKSQNIWNKYLVGKVLGTQSYDIMDGRPKEIDVSNWETSHFESITMTMNSNQTIKIVDFDQKRQIIIVQTENPMTVGRYQIILTGYIKDYQSTVKIMLHVQNTCATISITKSTPTNMFYDLSWVGEPIEQSFSQWFPSLPQCGVFKYQLVSSQQIPYYIKFNAQNRVIKVQPPTTLKEPATFNLAILGTLPQTSILEHFKVHLTFRCQYTTIYSNPFNDYVYDLGSGIQFIEFQQWKTSLNECGQINFKISTMDGGSLPSGSLLAIDQQNLRIKINSSESSLNGKELIIEVKGSLKMNSKSSLQFFTLTFLKLNEKQRGKSHIFSSNCSQQIFPTIKSIDMNGRITIEFPQQMSFFDHLQSLSNATIFTFKIIQQEQNLTNQVKGCQFESFTDQGLIVKVSFRDPQILSTSKVYDQLVISFRHNELFRDNKTQLLCVPRDYTIQGMLPPQMGDSRSAKTLNSAAETSVSTVTSAVSLNLFLSLFLGVSLKRVWGLLNTLQILNNIPLMGINLPSNAMILFQSLIDLSNFNFIDKEKVRAFIKKIFGGSDSTKAKEINKRTNFSLMGFKSSSNVWENLGLVFLVLLGLILLSVAFYALKYALLKQSILKRLYDKAHEILFFSVFLRAFQKGYLNFCVSIFLSLQQGSQINPKAFGFSVFMIIVLISIPIFIMYHLKKNFDKILSDTAFNKSWDSIYQNLRVTGGPKLLITQISIYFIRRLVYAIILVFMTDYPAFQLILFTIMSSTILTFHYKNFPVYDDKMTLYLDIYNEVTILLIGFCLYPFASEWVQGYFMMIQHDFLQGAKRRSRVGYCGVDFCKHWCQPNLRDLVHALVDQELVLKNKRQVQ